MGHSRINVHVVYVVHLHTLCVVTLHPCESYRGYCSGHPAELMGGVVTSISAVGMTGRRSLFACSIVLQPPA